MIFEAISNLCGAIKEGLGFARQRDAENNTPAMQANARAETEEEIAQKIAHADEDAQQQILEEAQRLAAE